MCIIHCSVSMCVRVLSAVYACCGVLCVAVCVLCVLWVLLCVGCCYIYSLHLHNVHIHSSIGGSAVCVH